MKLGSLLADIGRQAKLTDEDFAVFVQVRDQSPDHRHAANDSRQRDGGGDQGFSALRGGRNADDDVKRH